MDLSRIDDLFERNTGNEIASKLSSRSLAVFRCIVIATAFFSALGFVCCKVRAFFFS